VNGCFKTLQIARYVVGIQRFLGLGRVFKPWKGEAFGRKILVSSRNLSPECYALRAGYANAPTSI